MARPTASMVLPTPGGPRSQHVGFLLDELERGEVTGLAGVQVGLEGEVERVEALVVWEPGELQRVAEPAALAQADLFLEGKVDELQIPHLGLLSPGDQGVEVVGEPGQAEPLGVLADPGGDQLAHDPTPASWS